jgi:hypothetical protein
MIITSIWGLVNLNFTNYSSNDNTLIQKDLHTLCFGHGLLCGSIPSYFIIGYM